MDAPATQQRLDTAIRSLTEYVQGVWEGTEGIEAIIQSLEIVKDEYLRAKRDAASTTALEPTREELIQVVRAYGYALDMSDSEHPNFRDSMADTVENLWLHEATVRRIIGSLSSAPAPAAAT